MVGMTSVIGAVVLALHFVALEAEAGEAVRVRILKNRSQVAIQGLSLDIKGVTPAIKRAALPSMDKIYIHRVSSPAFSPRWQIRIEGEKEVRRVFGPRLHIEGQSMRVGMDLVPQIIELMAVEGQGIDVVAELDLEKYLLGVLPAEMPASWPEQALMAQAVASRSYTMSLLRERRNQNFHLESTVLDQVFAVAKQAEASRAQQNKILRAIRATNGQVLLSADGKILKAFYHADCGGATELARNVWGEKVNEPGTTTDASCPVGPLAQWSYRIERQDLRKKLLNYFSLPLMAALDRLVVVGRTFSGRVDKVDAVFSGYPTQRLTSNEFRRLIGFDKMRSTNFSLHWSPGYLEIKGKGHGHGVGLCQYGARDLAIRGSNYMNILKHYYPKANINKTSLPIL